LDGCIKYLRMPDGFMYLVAIIDVYSCYVVSWILSNTLDTAFCIEALRVVLTVASSKAGVKELNFSIAAYMQFYNYKRRQQSPKHR
jgi:hypothetical protein